IDLCYDRYNLAWAEALKRLGLSRTSALASWNKVAASLESVTRSKLSLRSSAEGASLSQTPSVRTIEKSSQATQILPFEESFETKKSDTITPPSSINKITTKEAKIKVKKG
ncbi:hypothetical protein ACFL1Z_07515, partial [Thermodesulfobacteriota bacterium]